MPYKNKLEAFFGTLFHSWGGDTPQEAVWAANELIDALNEMFNLGITDEFYTDGTKNGNTWEELTTEVYNALKPNGRPTHVG